jgi:hypothetical protein
VNIRYSFIDAQGATSNYGILNTNSAGGSYKVTVNHSQIKGNSNTILNAAGFTTQIGASQLDGGDVSNSGTLTCYGVYDENYTNSSITDCP